MTHMMRASIVGLVSVLLFACGGDDAADDTGDDTGDDSGDDSGDDTAGECGDGTVDSGEECDDGNTDSGDGCDSSCLLEDDTVTTARLTSLELRDPHLWYSGVFDVTDTVNSSISDAITMDSDDPADGQLDLSFLLQFRPWNPDGASAGVDAVAGANCAAPDGTSCTADPEATIVETTATNGDTTCLSPGADTTSDYDPPVTTPSGRCFATDKHEVTLSLGSVVLTLDDTQFGATYSESDHTLSNGLMVGFISEADADATTIPEDVDIVGGEPLSSLFLEEDKDTGPDGVAGWWFYLNFAASEVTYTE